MRYGVCRLGVALLLVASGLATGCGGAAAPAPRLPAPDTELVLPGLLSTPEPPPALRADLAGFVQAAVSPDPEVAAPAIAALRAAGPAGLDALFAVYPEAVDRLGSGASRGEAEGPPAADPDRVRAALESVARQRDAHAARLYWYTDLDDAIRAARAAHKPILSLRLLGNLDEELSCANSRFFRTALYPNARVGRLLRDAFVLHWQSERPAPRITIDFGDGRRIVRTLTGNSVHYVLDEQGRPVDALPGLYGPEAFLRGLVRAREAALATSAQEGAERAAFVRAWHLQGLSTLAASWEAEVASLGAPGALPPANSASANLSPPASAAAPTAISKAAVEVPVVAALQGDVAALPAPTDDQVWAALIARRAWESRLDAASRRLMRVKIAAEVDASGTRLLRLDDAAFARRVAAFERSLAEDTVRNEFGMHRTLRTWMAASPADALEALNQRVYASLFLTPRSDPWLGLLAPDGYAAIDYEGIVLESSRDRR